MSKQNSMRKGKKQNCRNAEGSSGVTLHAVLSHLRRRRPKITFLENVSEMEQASNYNDETEAWESEADWLKEQLSQDGFTCITSLMEARDYRAPMRRLRWWAVVIDLPPAYVASMGIEASILEFLNGFKDDAGLGPYGYENFLLDKDVLERLEEAMPYKNTMLKRNRTDEEWKGTHQTFCLKHGLDWPRFFFVSCNLVLLFALVYVVFYMFSLYL